MSVTVAQLEYQGLTYRQIDYWTSRGYLRADSSNPGSGTDRTWLDGETHVASRMLALIEVGFRLGKAHELARSDDRWVLLPAVTTVDDDPTPTEQTLHEVLTQFGWDDYGLDDVGLADSHEWARKLSRDLSLALRNQYGR